MNNVNPQRIVDELSTIARYHNLSSPSIPQNEALTLAEKIFSKTEQRLKTHLDDGSLYRPGPTGGLINLHFSVMQRVIINLLEWNLDAEAYSYSMRYYKAMQDYQIH